MPYRRLPNTDQARIRALSSALKKIDATRNAYLVEHLTMETIMKMKNFLRKFQSAHAHYEQCYANQSAAAKVLLQHSKKARLYLSHFIQVLNMCILRGEIKASHKKLYELPMDATSLPNIATDAQLAEWAPRIIQGENERLAHNGIPIYNPTIAKVKVFYDLFYESYLNQKNLQLITNKSREAVAQMREEADGYILQVWNEVEKMYESEADNENRLSCCREYGLIYYYRTKEKKSEL